MLTEKLLNRYARCQGAFLYHVTDAGNVESILMRGLVPGGGESQFDPCLIRPGHVYLCNHRIALWSLKGYFDCSWGDFVLRVDIRKLDAARFNADEEYWRGGERRDGEPLPRDWKSLKTMIPNMDEPDQVYGCLLDFGSVAYHGMITPTLLQPCQRVTHSSIARIQKLRPRRRLRSAPDGVGTNGGCRV
jgi:hypothetical protein